MKEDQCGCRIIHQDKVDKAHLQALEDTDVDALAQIFKALADPSRLKIVNALQRQEMCVCDIAAFLGLSESAVSHQLRLLRTLNLVRRRREGTVLYYRLVDDHVRELLSIGLEHVVEKNIVKEMV